MTERPQIRLQDVAERAGVSIATASRILGDPGYGGRAGLRERVSAAAVELGYRPNLHARALAKSSSANVGLVVHDVRDAYFAMISGGVISVAEKHDVLVNMVCTYRDAARELDYVRRLAAQRVRALILAGSGFRDADHNAAMAEELAAYEDAGGSVVSVGRARSTGHAVGLDNTGGMRRLVHELVGLGHQRFGVIAGPQRLDTVRDRLQGIRQGLRDHGLALERNDVTWQDMSRDGGRAGAAVLCRRRNPPTCVIGIADVVAVGALSWAHESGMSVPRELSIAGFGGIAAALDAVPPLTTVELPLERIGEVAMELALRPSTPRHTVEIEGNVVLRGSTGAPRPE